MSADETTLIAADTLPMMTRGTTVAQKIAHVTGISSFFPEPNDTDPVSTQTNVGSKSINNACMLRNTRFIFYFYFL